jgi:VWFA-related protein
MRLPAAALALALLSALAAARQPQPEAPQPEMPRFRAGTNLVRVDVYASKDGVSVAELTAEDFEVFEDNQPQKIESFEFIKPRPPVPQELRAEPRSLPESRQMAADPAARLFVLFYDLQNVSIAGAYHSNKPIFEFLNKVIGQDDMVGVMTSDMSPLSLTFARRTTALEKYFTQNWAWGQRNQLISTDPIEEMLKDCYFGLRSREGGLQDVLSRHRESKTLMALDGLVTHLDGIREERKFVLVFTEGWRLHQPDPRSASPVEGEVPQGKGVGIDQDGRLTTGPPAGSADYARCEQYRLKLAGEDHHADFQRLTQRANRANVSFYPVDGRGLQVYDERYQFSTNQPIATQTNARRESLLRLAADTDGMAVVNTNDVSGGMARIVSDVASYYLLSYYSTNSKMDGRFRRIRVRVRKPGIEARARPGYLAPTDAEMRAGTTAVAASAAPPRPSAPEAVVKALGQIDSSRPRGDVKAFRRGPATGLAYQPASDARFRRTERVRLEFPVADGASLTGRLLTRQGQPLPLTVETSTRPSDAGAVGVADLVLAPLAPGEYVIEVVAAGAESVTTHYGFRIIP